jgi:hypothetical protein
LLLDPRPNFGRRSFAVPGCVESSECNIFCEQAHEQSRYYGSACVTCSDGRTIVNELRTSKARAAGRQTPSLIGHFRRSSRKRERKNDKQQSVQISLSNLMIAPTIAALRTIAYVVLITKFER